MKMSQKHVVLFGAGAAAAVVLAYVYAQNASYWTPNSAGSWGNIKK